MQKAFWIGILGLIFGIIFAKIPWLLGTKALKGQLSAQSHFHIAALDLVFLSIALIMVAGHWKQFPVTCYGLIKI